MVHLEELESATSKERTMSDHNDNVEALSCRCTPVCDSGEIHTTSHHMTCSDAPRGSRAYLTIPTLAGVNCPNSRVKLLDDPEKIARKRFMEFFIFSEVHS